MLAGLTAVLFGASNGVSSSALQNLLDLNGLRGPRKLGPLREGLIIASAWAGAILGTLGAPAAPSTRLALLAAALLQSLGGLVAILAPTLPVLVAGRLLCGLGNGLVAVALNTYTGEIAPPLVRGGTIALQETAFLMGALGGALVGRASLRMKGGWRRSWGLGFPLGLVAFAVLLWMPDTPRAIFRRSLAALPRDAAAHADGSSGGTGSDGAGRAAVLAAARVEAERTLCRMRGLTAPDDALQAELDEIEELYAGGPSGGPGLPEVSLLEILGSRQRRQLLLACTVAVSCPALCGHAAFEGFGTEIFHAVGYGTSTSADLMVGLYAVRLATTLPDFLWLDIFGRRTLMAAGLAGIGGSYAVAGLGQAAGKRGVVAGAVLLGAAAYQAAVGPLTWIVPAEVFPADMRLKGGVMSSMVYAAGVQLVLQLHPLLAQHGVMPFLAVYTGTTCLALVLNRALLPETVGRSLEDIEREALNGGLWRRGSMEPARGLLGLEAGRTREA